MTPGSDITVATDGAVINFALVRYGTATHAVDTDQRRIPLTPTRLPAAAESPPSQGVAQLADSLGGRRLTQSSGGVPLSQLLAGQSGEFQIVGELGPALTAPPAPAPAQATVQSPATAPAPALAPALAPASPPATAAVPPAPPGPAAAGLCSASAPGRPCYRLSLPADPGVILPGYWMLFALNRRGVPSRAATVQVVPAG